MITSDKERCALVPCAEQIARLNDSLRQRGDPSLTLNAFILSNTAFENLLNNVDRKTQADLEDRHLLFMISGRDRYLAQLITKTLQAA